MEPVVAPQRRDGAILALVCAAQFMVVLDVSIVNVALPTIRHALGFSPTGLQWVVNAYNIAFAGFLLLGGRAADLYGQRRMFITGLLLFTAASLIGGFAQTQGMLVGARIAQGLGGAVLSPATLTILITTFAEGPRRARALGAWSALAGAGGAAGALLGGVLTDLVSWRWILFVNVPLGFLALVAARYLLLESRDQAQHRSLDLPGAVLVTAGLMAFVYGIVDTNRYAWGSAHTVLTLAAAMVLLALFVGNELAVAPAPLVSFRIFRSRSVSGANLVMFCLSGAIFASWYFLSLYMQNVLGYSPLRAGLAFLPQTLAIIVGAQLAARLVTRVGARAMLTVSPLITLAGLAWLSNLPAHGAYWQTLFGPSVLVTFGMGLAFTPIAVAATSGVPREQSGLASGLVNTMRMVGGALGLAVLATVATDRSTALLHGRSLSAGLARAGHALPAPLAHALTSGYGRAFLISAAVAAVASAAALSLPRAALGPARPFQEGRLEQRVAVDASEPARPA